MKNKFLKNYLIMCISFLNVMINIQASQLNPTQLQTAQKTNNVIKNVDDVIKFSLSVSQGRQQTIINFADNHFVNYLNAALVYRDIMDCAFESLYQYGLLLHFKFSGSTFSLQGYNACDGTPHHYIFYTKTLSSSIVPTAASLSLTMANNDVKNVTISTNVQDFWVKVIPAPTFIIGNINGLVNFWLSPSIILNGYNSNGLTNNVIDLQNEVLTSFEFTPLTFLNDKSSADLVDILQYIKPSELTSGIQLVLIGMDAQNNVIPSFPAANFDHFYLLMFNDIGNMLWSTPAVINSDAYYIGQTPNVNLQQYFSNFKNNKKNLSLAITVNGKAYSNNSLNYPYCVAIKNIGGINVANKNLTLSDLQALMPKMSNVPLNYDVPDILSLQTFSLNVNNQYNFSILDLPNFEATVAPLMLIGAVQLIFVGVDVNDNIITTNTPVAGQNYYTIDPINPNVDHYLLYIFDAYGNPALSGAITIPKTDYIKQTGSGANGMVSVIINSKQQSLVNYPFSIIFTYQQPPNPIIPKTINTLELIRATYNQEATIASNVLELIRAAYEYKPT